MYYLRPIIQSFKRVLKPAGVIIKVIPGQDYLQELRDVVGVEQGKPTYSNEQVIKHFEENLKVEAMYQSTTNLK